MRSAKVKRPYLQILFVATAFRQFHFRQNNPILSKLFKSWRITQSPLIQITFLGLLINNTDSRTRDFLSCARGGNICPCEKSSYSILWETNSKPSSPLNLGKSLSMSVAQRFTMTPISGISVPSSSSMPGVGFSYASVTRLLSFPITRM